MNSQQEQFLNLKNLPARVRVEEAAWLLGFSIHEIPILAAHGLIKPLGHPTIAGVKFFSVVGIEELRRDEKWLAKACDCIADYWRKANLKQKAARNDHNQDAQPMKNDFKRSSPFSGLRSARRLADAVE
jgi:hypothetical protein